MDNVKFDGIELIKLIKRYWVSPLTISLIMVALGTGMLFLFINVDFDVANLSNKMTLAKWAILFFVLSLVFGYWYYSRRVPVAKKGTVGIAIALKTENEAEKGKLNADFIEPLRKMLMETQRVCVFSVVVIPDHFIVDDQKAMLQCMRKANCYIMIMGSVRLRNNTYYMDFDGAVLHQPIPQEVSKVFGSEFRDILERRIICENDLISFEITSEYINLVSRYIAGAAALLSGNINLGRSLLEEAQELLKVVRQKSTALNKIRQYLQIKLAEVYMLYIVEILLKWCYDRNDVEILRSAKPLLDKLQQLHPNHYGAHLVRAIYIFVIDGNCDKALAEINKCRGVNEATWYFNCAFLYAYKGNLESATKLYKGAVKRSCAESTYIQIKEFIQWILIREPDKIQLHYCLGYINLYGKKDKEAALSAFEAFILHCPENKFSEHQFRAKELISKILHENRSEAETA